MSPIGEINHLGNTKRQNYCSHKIFTLNKNKPNELISFYELGITVKTHTGTRLVKRDYIDFAWNKLLEDGVLFQNDYKKSTHRSSFILTLFVNYGLPEVNSISPLSIKLNVFNNNPD